MRKRNKKIGISEFWKRYYLNINLSEFIDYINNKSSAPNEYWNIYKKELAYGKKDDGINYLNFFRSLFLIYLTGKSYTIKV